MRVFRRTAWCLSLILGGLSNAAQAERTDLEVRVLARGAKFLAGYTAPVRVVLTDADTCETLVQGLTAGTTGDTAKIMGGAKDRDGRLASADSAVFRTSLDIDRPRRVTLSVTGPLSQPQAATTATSTQWVLPGRHVTAGDGWLVELPGLIVDLASPLAYQRVKAGASVPLRVGVTMLCGCAIGENGPWRAADTEVDAYLSVDGGEPHRFALRFDPDSSLFQAELPTAAAGVYELEVRAWMGASNNAGVARTAFFVH